MTATPGPWKWNENFNEITDQSGDMLVAVPATNTGLLFDRFSPDKPDVEEWYANARLIAAAPVMLVALKVAALALEMAVRTGDPASLNSVRAAIALAEGTASDSDGIDRSRIVQADGTPTEWYDPSFS